MTEQSKPVEMLRYEAGKVVTSYEFIRGAAIAAILLGGTQVAAEGAGLMFIRFQFGRLDFRPSLSALMALGADASAVGLIIFGIQSLSLRPDARRWVIGTAIALPTFLFVNQMVFQITRISYAPGNIDWVMLLVTFSTQWMPRFIVAGMILWTMTRASVREVFERGPQG